MLGCFTLTFMSHTCFPRNSNFYDFQMRTFYRQLNTVCTHTPSFTTECVILIHLKRWLLIGTIATCNYCVTVVQYSLPIEQSTSCRIFHRQKTTVWIGFTLECPIRVTHFNASVTFFQTLTVSEEYKWTFTRLVHSGILLSPTIEIQQHVAEDNVHPECITSAV